MRKSQPTSGQVVYDGVSIQTLGEQYRDIFGYLPQDFGFPQEFTVKDYLVYVAALKGLPEQQSRRRIHELLERVSLLDVCNKKISRLSGGMKHRVGIARALLNECGSPFGGFVSVAVPAGQQRVKWKVDFLTIFLRISLPVSDY